MKKLNLIKIAKFVLKTFISILSFILMNYVVYFIPYAIVYPLYFMQKYFTINDDQAESYFEDVTLLVAFPSWLIGFTIVYVFFMKMISAMAFKIKRAVVIILFYPALFAAIQIQHLIVARIIWFPH